MNTELDVFLINYLESHREDMISDIQSLVAIESAVDPENACDGKPFGPGPALALEKALSQCEEAGLITRNFDGYAGDATWGQGEGSVAVLTHLDCVPLGDGWTVDPLGGQIRGDLIYGRGTNDDKGPGVSALWAVKALKASGFQPRRPIRLIYGCSEETGGGDMDWYLSHADAPAFAFTPDANFPVIHAEKSFVSCRARYAYAAPTRIRSFHAGTRVNVVPYQAEVLLDASGLSLVSENNISLRQEDALTRIVATGKAAHASMPQDGINAIGLLMTYLKKYLPVTDGAFLPVSILAERIGIGYDGAGCHVDCADEVSGPMTFNVGLLDGDTTSVSIQIDIRHPVTLDEKATARKLGDFFTGHGFNIELLNTRPGLFYPKDHPLVATLQDVYNSVTGTSESPIAIGGGTYAKAMPCPAVAFGPCFPWDTETAHIADEYMSIASLQTAARIYALALARLSEEQ